MSEKQQLTVTNDQKVISVLIRQSGIPEDASAIVVKAFDYAGQSEPMREISAVLGRKDTSEPLKVALYEHLQEPASMNQIGFFEMAIAEDGTLEVAKSHSDIMIVTARTLLNDDVEIFSPPLRLTLSANGNTRTIEVIATHQNLPYEKNKPGLAFMEIMNDDLKLDYLGFDPQIDGIVKADLPAKRER